MLGDCERERQEFLTEGNGNTILPEIIYFKEKHHLSVQKENQILELPLLDAVTLGLFFLCASHTETSKKQPPFQQ